MDIASIAQPSRGDGAESIKVLVRVRPLSSSELAERNDSVVEILSDQALNVTSADGKKSFKCAFDSVLGPNSSQTEVYAIVRGCTESVIDGFNSTIFAYGQTGSGKTYSMYGPPTTTNAPMNAGNTSVKAAAPRNVEQMGLIPRAIEEIFELVHNRAITDFQVHCSFVQIYNENLYDMLRDSSMNTPLSIREDNKEIYVQGLSEYNVKSVADTLQLLKIAEENRAIRETNMNMFSSRSHSIFQIQLEHKRVADDGGEITYRAKFNLVDLAGSEKWNTKLQMRDEHITEMTNINLSLHTLGKCISALAQASIRQNNRDNRDAAAGSRTQTREKDRDWDARSLGSLDHSGSTAGSIKDFPVPRSGRYSNNNGTASAGGGGNTNREPGTHVPFRESKLTRLLQDSLGGNARTFLIATISPARSNSEESISTLKFADRAKQVMVQAVVNETRPVDYALVKRLQQEVEMLKSLLKRMVQSQNPNNGAGNAAANINAAIFNAKLKQASSASDFNELLNSGSGVGGGNAGHGTAQDPGGYNANMGNSVGGSHMSSPYTSAMSPGRYSPEQTGTASSATAAAGAPAGGGLEYVMSLEKALNQEQIHAQHLGKKNETLIKELEELKFQNMQLVQNNQTLYGTRGGAPGGGASAGYGSAASAATPAPLVKQVSINSLDITAAQVAQVISSVQALLKENTKLFEHCEQTQKVMRKFFKFQIEEEDMKKSLEQVFTAVKEVKASSASSSVVDNFAFLEFLATNVNSKGAASAGTSPSPGKGGNRDQSQAYDASEEDYRPTPQPHAVVTKKQLRRDLPAVEHAQPAPSAGAAKSSSSGVTVAGVPVRENKKSHAYIAQQELAQQRSLPSLQHQYAPAHAHAAAEEESRTVQRGRELLHSAGSDMGADNQLYPQYPQMHTPVAHASNHQRAAQGYDGYDPQYQQPQYQPPQYQQPYQQPYPQQFQPQQQQAYPQQHQYPQHQQGMYPTPSGYNDNAQGTPIQGLSYRLRGGVPPQQQGQQQSYGAPLSNSSSNSLASSGGWVMTAEEDAAAAEAALKAELKQAKKKLKKQQKMAEWQRIKEEKQRAELEAEEAQRAAELEAEAQKEQRRKEYVQKQKQKLAQYQSKVKSEAEKIQELKNLGIDPSSLF